MSDEVNIKNKRASHEYEFLQKYTAGMQLLGTEIKSIRAKEANLRDAHCTFIGGELWVKNLQISEYSHGGMSNHQPKRDRKLLLNARELDKLFKGSSTKGLAIIPLRLFIGKRGFAKLGNSASFTYAAIQIVIINDPDSTDQDFYLFNFKQ